MPSRSAWECTLLALLVLLSGCADTAASGVGGDLSFLALREDAEPRIYREDEVDVPARPIAPLQPVYPPQLEALGIEGEVEARVIVLADGSVGGARLLESTRDEFVAALREALREARFYPALRRGKPVSSWITVRVRFRLGE